MSLEELRTVSPAPARPTKGFDCFKADCAMGVRGAHAAEGVIVVDVPKQRTRFEAFGGWSVTRFDLGVSASQFLSTNPPDVKVQEEPMMNFHPPEGAKFEGMQKVDGKDCQKWTFVNKTPVMTAPVELWVTVDGDVASPVLVYQKKSASQTVELRFISIEKLESTEDEKFAIEQHVPEHKPDVVSVKGTVKIGEKTIHGATISAAHAEGKKHEWTARVTAHSHENGEYELLLTPKTPWKVVIQAPRANSATIVLTPEEGGLSGGDADVTLEASEEEENVDPTDEQELEGEAATAAGDAAGGVAAAAAAAEEAKAHAPADKKAELQKKVDSKTFACWAEKHSVSNAGSFLMSNWKKRWFTQSGASIDYREKQTSKPLRGVTLSKETRVLLEVSKNVHPQATAPERDIVIEFPEKGKKMQLLLRFQNAADKEKWGQHLHDLQELQYLS